MTHQVVIIKSYKNVGIAILFTFVLGPIGLFYCSLTGGIVMTVAPVITIWTLVYNSIVNQPITIYNILYTLLSSYAIFIVYYVITIIWAIIATLNYNQELDSQISNEREILARRSPAIHEHGNLRSEFSLWLRNNPGKSLNDYYAHLNRKS